MKNLLTTIILFAAAFAASAQDWKAPVESDKVESPFSLEDEKSILKGEKLFGNMCWTCHGEEGKGDGLAAEGLEVKPADLTSTLMQSQSDGSFYWKITHGRGLMVGYEDALSDKQRWQLVAFIRSIAAE